MRIVLGVLAAVLCGALGIASFANAEGYDVRPNPPQAIIIGVDLSRSNPLIDDEAFARKVAARISPIIRGLAPRSRVTLRSFGAYDSASNATLSLDVVIAPKTARAEDIAVLIDGVVGGIPKMIREGRLRAQGSTNILPFLDNVATNTDCRAMPTMVILASDGVEDSRIVNMTRRNATLPLPSVAPFPGCEELVILGVGRGLDDPRATERLRNEWGLWARAAGFKRFTGVNDW